MGSFSMFHWLIVILVLLLLFGPRRFADAAKGLGQALRGFKEELGKAEAEHHTGVTAEEAKRLPPADPESSASGAAVRVADRKHDA